MDDKAQMRFDDGRKEDDEGRARDADQAIVFQKECDFDEPGVAIVKTHGLREDEPSLVESHLATAFTKDRDVPNLSRPGTIEVPCLSEVCPGCAVGYCPIDGVDVAKEQQHARSELLHPTFDVRCGRSIAERKEEDGLILVTVDRVDLEGEDELLDAEIFSTRVYLWGITKCEDGLEAYAKPADVGFVLGALSEGADGANIVVGEGSAIVAGDEGRSTKIETNV